MYDNYASDKFYNKINEIWEKKTVKVKLKEIEETLKKLAKNNCIVSGKLTIKEQAKNIYDEIYKHKGWSPNVWLKIHLGVKNGENNLGLLVSHGKYKDVHIVFSDEKSKETYFTVDHKLFHFEGKDAHDQIVYIKKQDIKPLSFSSFEHWSEKWKELYREYLGLEPGFNSKIFAKEEKLKDEHPRYEDFTKPGGSDVCFAEEINSNASFERQITTFNYQELDSSKSVDAGSKATHKKTTKSSKRKKKKGETFEFEDLSAGKNFEEREVSFEDVDENWEDDPDAEWEERPRLEGSIETTSFISLPEGETTTTEEKVDTSNLVNEGQPYVFKFHVPEDEIILSDIEKIRESIKFKIKEMSTEIDNYIYGDFYDFQDPYMKDFWSNLVPKKKIELAKHAQNNNISLESATRLYYDVVKTA